MADPVKTAGIRELKAHLSEYLQQVQAGARVKITDRGRVVAELVSVAGRASPGGADEILRPLAAAGMVQLPTRPHSDLARLWKNKVSPALSSKLVQGWWDEGRGD